ncbi:DUF2917 domain-containing protein [Pelotalea chapellei]|uniref:DUF2917 domain-containing protein n=1 Tax=Pelotalea chapellei TaxID=44671 RepID=A0ABS5U9T2_9BACT|nr:DUF2917 domain-containing protein [Pelotalea chapellei]MBT1072425.1 DUF2917 domain-containing protein [Pelotalea chapellei]
MECCFRKGELMRLDGGKAGLILRCSSGAVWLTRGDGADYLVAPGKVFELPRGESAIVEALQTSELYLGKPALMQKTVIRLAPC